MAEGDLLDGFETVLVMGGGNALGAYHLGVCEALLAVAEPRWIVGCSIGAVTAAILLGNPPETRLDRLREFWRQVAFHDELWAGWMPAPLRARWSNGLGLNALLAGRRGITAPRFPGLLSLLPGVPPDVSMQDHAPLRAMLDRLVDWGRVNNGPTRFSFLATDLERGEEAWWDNRQDRIGAPEVLASASLPPLLPPVEIQGRLFWDGGLGNNLPVDRVFREPPARPVLVIASDLYAPEGPAPGSLDGAALRAQDLGFALQARTRIEGLMRERALRRQAEPATPPAILAHLVHRPPVHQRALKALDFSGTAVAERRAQGRADLERVRSQLPGVARDEALAVVTLASA